MTVATIFAAETDGEMRCNSTVYATARAGTGTMVVNTSGTANASGQEFFSSNYYCYEYGLDFDTSGVPANAIISSAVLSLVANAKGATSSGAAIHRARLSDWGATLTSADWIAGASLGALTLLAHLAQADAVVGSYVAFVDDAMAANVVKAGHTRMLVVSDRLEDGTAPGSGTEYVIWRTANQSGTTNDPKLVVTYTVPAGFSQAVMT